MEFHFIRKVANSSIFILSLSKATVATETCKSIIKIVILRAIFSGEVILTLLETVDDKYQRSYSRYLYLIKSLWAGKILQCTATKHEISMRFLRNKTITIT